MNISITTTGAVIELEAGELISLASFLSHFTDKDMVDLIGTECTANVSTLSDRIIPQIIHDKELS